MAGLTAIATVAGLVGSAVSAAGTIAAGNAAQQQADYVATQYDIKAKEEQAQGQLEARQLREKKELAQSA